MVTIDKKQAIVAIIVLIATAYFTIFYDIFKESLKPFLKDYPIYTLYATAGFMAMGFGVFVLVFFIKRQDKSRDENNNSLDNKPNPEQKIDSLDNDLHGDKKLLLLDVGIFALIGWCLFFAVYLYYHEDKIIYNFSETTFNDTEGKIPNFDVAYNFSTTVFSAQNDIDVSIMAKFNENLLKNHPDEPNKTNLIYVYFPTSNPSNPQYIEGHILSAPIILHKSTSDSRFFTGNGTIKYQSEGYKCTFVATSPLTESSNCPNKIYPLFNISSADSYFQYKNNKTTLALTWVLIAFTVVSLRDFFKNMFRNISLLRKRRNDTKEQKKKETPRR